VTNSLTLIGQGLHILLTIYLWIVIVGALISWVNPNPYNPIVRTLRRLTEPAFTWCRQVLPLRFGGIDFSPVLVIAGVVFLDVALVGSLVESGHVLANILLGLAQVVHIFLTLYLWIVVIAAIISWVSPDPYNPIVRLFLAATEPVFAWLRRRVPLQLGGIDFSPVLVIAAIVLLDTVITRALMTTALSMKMQGGLF